jgi:YfiH family protein
MQRITHDGIQWIEFELLKETGCVRHGSFLRKGGISDGPFASFNLLADSGDNPEKVEANRRQVMRCLDLEKIQPLHQVHGVETHHISTWQPHLVGDAVITRTPHLGLMVHHADCQAALFIDPVTRTIAAAHCGWRGSVANLYAKVVERMKQLDCDPANLLVAISPSLGPQHAQFINYRTEIPECYWDHQVKPDYFDFWAISERQLVESGVLPHHIQIAGLCTYAHPEECFSHRRDKPAGRHGTVISLI